MDARLIQLQERAGDDIDYGIAMGRHGTLHLIFLSDNAADMLIHMIGI